jgi:hypothetical protein
MSGILNVSGNIPTPTGSQYFNLTQLTYNSPIGATTVVVLSSGDNTISIPTGTTTIIIQPPVNNTFVLKLKGVAGDTGVTLNKTSYQIYQPDTTQTSFIINSASAQASPTTITFL